MRDSANGRQGRDGGRNIPAGRAGSYGSFEELGFRPLRTYLAVNELSITLDPDVVSAQRGALFGNRLCVENGIIGNLHIAFQFGVKVQSGVSLF
jgi:hypothetical protein